MLGISGINPMMMGGAYGMYGGMGMMGMGAGMNGNGNIPQSLQQRYGNGYADFGSRPYANPYPMGIVPQRLNINEESTLKKFFKFATL